MWCRFRCRSSDELLDCLKIIAAQQGRISIALIAATPNVPSPQTYRTRFGSLVKAYRLLGYKAIWNEQRVEQKYRVQAIRSNLLSQIAALSGGRVTIDISPTRHARLRLRTGRLVSVIASRCLFGYNSSLRWLVKPVPAERKYIALVARLNEGNNDLKDLFVISPIRDFSSLVVSVNDARLQQGFRLGNLVDFFETVQTVAER